MEVTIQEIIGNIMLIIRDSFGFIVPIIALLGAINFVFNLIVTAFIGIGGKAGKLK